MRRKEGSVQNSIGRAVFVFLAVVSQIMWVLFLFLKLNKYSTFISLATTVLTLIVVLWMYNTKMPMGFKLPWIMLILAFPVLGLALYLLLGRSDITRGMRIRIEKIDERLKPWIVQENRLLEELKEKDPSVCSQMKYLSRYANFPVYKNTDVVFFKDASEGLEAQLNALEKAEKFIFMEYHAIEDAVSFGRMKQILIQKVQQGVDVRILYDDVGSIGFIDSVFVKKMEALGIQCRVFNPLVPVLNMIMNNRDHRKITIIDGKTGFTGGYNLADHYFNLEQVYGHWKDTGVMLTGDAVLSLTATFLELWAAMSKTEMEDVSRFFEKNSYQSEEKGFIQPFTDSPLDDEPVGENVYMNMVKLAKEYVYFTTPYLVITDEMQRELTMAVKRGVDVRLITPGIPDKKSVYEVTRSNYVTLVKAGVRIYEYTPGFIHAKECICDDKLAVIGTINLDYRSLYLHFENGVLLYDCKAVLDMRKDYEDTLKKCAEVSEKQIKNIPAWTKIKRSILRLFAPLL